MQKKDLFILDVSSFVFRAYYALPPLTNALGQSTHALYGFIRSVHKLIKDFQVEHLVAVFDGPDNKKQRVEIYEKYKANRIRADADLPQQMELVKVFCELSGISHLEVGGVEADDTIGSVSTKATQEGFTVYIYTSDKDLCQLVNDKTFVINTWKENLLVDKQKVEELYGVPPERIIDLLAMMGDSSDNIPGLRGFGPKTSIELLKQFGSLDEVLKKKDQVKGAKKQQILKEQEELALLSRRLATIHTDIEFSYDPEWFIIRPPNIGHLKSFYVEMGFNAMVRDLEEGELSRGRTPIEDKTDYQLIDDESSLKELIQTLADEPIICLDVETTGLQPMLSSLVGVGLTTKEKLAYYIPLNGKLGASKVIPELKKLFENPKHQFYGHNVKFDCHILENVGIHIANLQFDTMLASYLLNSSSRKHSLDHLSLQYFGKIKTPIKNLIGTGKQEITLDLVPIPKVADYCCEDVDYTCRLKKALEKELKERKLEPLLFDLELPLSQVLTKVERNGMYIDVPHLQKMSIELGKEIASLEEEIYKLAGETFNLNSPKQLSAILFEKLKIKPLKKTATGLSTNMEVLEVLAEQYPIAKKIISFRLLDKLKSTYVDSLPLSVNPNTHRVHPTFNQVVAATGRLSCQDPNLQNIPIRSELGRKIREAFTPQIKGWSYVAADYSQIELRLLAHLSEDPNLIQAFNDGEDIHAYTASLMFGTPLEKITSVERHQAKAINFGIIYGQQAYGLSQVLNIDMRIAAEFIKAYFERYPKVAEFIESCIQKTKKTGRSVTMIGREREIPEIHSGNSQIRAAAHRLAINTPLQGSAADLIKVTMLKIDAELVSKKMESKMILQIHDELIFEAPAHELVDLQRLVKKNMEEVVALKVPLIVDISVGENWGEC